MVSLEKLLLIDPYFMINSPCCLNYCVIAWLAAGNSGNYISQSQQRNNEIKYHSNNINNFQKVDVYCFFARQNH